MNSDRFERIKEILLRVVDLPEAERKAILDEACADDPELRVEIEELLALDRLSALSRLVSSNPSASRSASSGDDMVMAASLLSGRFAPGLVLGNRYRIDRLLGHGGMGEVYCARDLDLGVPVALKTIRPEIASDPAVLRRFKREVLLARSVTHPNVCRIYDQGRHRDATQDVTFLTMEFLPGETLETRIRSKGRMSRTEALPIAKQLADALDAAHQAGIVHRDFKSANVMLVPTEKDERAVITDFGLAMGAEEADVPAQAERSSGTSISGGPVFLGTPAYMSPEQVRGERVGPAADLYALGIVLFEMATGSVPFSGRTPLETALLRLGSPPPSLSALVDVEPEWESAILRLLSLEPEARFSSAGEAVAALEGREAAPAPGAVLKPSHRAAFHLPAERDRFVGRARELRDLVERLEDGPSQMTILGAGGSGKTRLARRYGWTSLDRWSGGVWFCDLSEAGDADGIVHAVATGLDVPLGKGDPIVQLGHAIAGRGRALIILDNFEQVREHAEATLGQWIARARETSFLVTSRERLQLEGETVLDLDPLDPETEGIELFAERARAQVAGFALGANRGVVGDIVRLVDGLPLAIELAAARLRTLSLEQLRARLVDRLGLLAGPKGGRQGTLRATLDWSRELLAPWEQAAVAQASVFEGGFTLEAAEAVLKISSWPKAPAVLDVVQALVDKSWLRARSALGAPRFEMFATVREYAAGKLRGDGAAAGVLAGATLQLEAEKRHGRYYAAMGTEEAVEALDRHGGVAKRAALKLEIDNLVAACRRAVERSDPDTAAGALAASWVLLSMTGPITAAVDLGRLVTEMQGLRPLQRARAMSHLGAALRGSGQEEEARHCFEEALRLYRELGDRGGEGRILNQLAIMDLSHGRTQEARRLFQDALALLREAGLRGSEGGCLGDMGGLDLMEGRLEDARLRAEESLAICRELGNRRGEARYLNNLGIACGTKGHVEEARRCHEEALMILREIGDRWGEGILLNDLGALHGNRGRREEAQRCFEEALIILRQVGNRRSEGHALGNLASSVEEGRAEEKQRLYEEAIAIYREIGDRAFEGRFLGDLGLIHGSQGRMEEAQRCIDEGIAIARAIGDRLGLAVSLVIFGMIKCDQENLPASHAALAEAEAMAKAQGVTADSMLGGRIAELRQALEDKERTERRSPGV